MISLPTFLLSLKTSCPISVTVMPLTSDGISTVMSLPARQTAHSRQNTVGVNGENDLFRSALRPFRVKRLILRHLVRERDFVRESFIRIPAFELISVTGRLRLFVYPRRCYRGYRSPVIHFENHGIFLRLFGLRSSDLFVIRIHAHVFRKPRLP